MHQIHILCLFKILKAQPVINLNYFRISMDHAHFEKKNGNDRIYESFRVDKICPNQNSIDIPR